MERHFDTSLRELKEKLVTLAGWVESAIENATLALQNGDFSKIENVHTIEKRVNQSHKEIDGLCVKLLALQQPLARDLRLIIAVIKINTDLERMADQAVNIAENASRYLKEHPLKPLIDLPIMFSQVRIMVGEVIDAFVKSDLLLAQNVLKRDDEVDRLKHKIFKDVLEVVKVSPTKVESGLTLILIARNLERIGDHATNIAEDVIFALTGEDIRHSARVEIVKDAIQ
jgi:phosphate transport system protein